jgi:beta-N-acetylhexosaminidase
MARAELIPFHGAVEANVAAIMTGHLLCPDLDPDLPVTLSSSIIGGLLRKELGFKGVLISDDLLMGALNRWGSLEERGKEALKAGVDCLLVGKGSVQRLFDALKQSLQTGEIIQERGEEALSRIAKLKERYHYKGIGDLKSLRKEQDLAFSQELFQRVKDATGNPGDRAA